MKAPGSAGAGEVNILACADGGFFQHVAVLLVSLLDNNPGQDFNLVVVTGNAGAEDRRKLQESLAGFPRARLQILDIPASARSGLHTRGRYTADIYTRLWIEDFFGPEVQRVLYLDSDMVVVGSIAGLWSSDLQGKMLGAVDIPGATRWRELSMPPGSGYFNSGVLLIDLQQWRAAGARDQVLATLRQHGAALDDPDQDALNMLFHARRMKLDYTWNAVSPFYKLSHDMQLPPEEIGRVQREARIIHFNGRFKPWSYLCPHPRRGEYATYLARTAWRGTPPQDRTPANIARRLVGPLIPRALKRWLRPKLR